MCRHRGSYHSDDSLVYYNSDHDFSDSDSDSAYTDKEVSERRAARDARWALKKKEEEARQFKICLVFAPMFLIVVIGAPLIITRRHEKSFYRDLSFNNTFDFDAWQETKSVLDQESRHEFETIQQASKIVLALEIFKLMPIDQQLQFNKWVPVPSLFKDVDDYLKSINKFQTATYQFMYLAEPKFRINGTATELIFEWGDFKHRQTFVKGRSDCDNCPKAEWSCKDGILTIKEDTLFVRRKFTRVYYIPIKDLLGLLPSH